MLAGMVLYRKGCSMSERTKTAAIVAVAITIGTFISRLFQLVGTTFVGVDAITDCDMNKGGRSGVPVNRLHGKVGKKSRIGGIAGFDYANMVNNARVKEAITDGKPFVFRLDDELRTAALASGIVTELEIISFEADRTQNALDNYNARVADGTIADAVKPFVAAERKWGNHVQTGCRFNEKTLKVEPILSKVLIEYTKDDEHRFYVQLAVLSHQKPTYFYLDNGKDLTDADLEYIRQYMPKKKEGSRQGLSKPIIIRDYRVDNVKTIRMNRTQYNIG